MTRRKGPPVARTTRKARTPWPDDVRERALEVMRVDGLAAAHVATGVPKTTLTGWARTGGVDLGAAAAKTRNATSARAAQLTTATVGRLELIADLASTGIIRRLEANADAAELDEADLGEWSTELERFTPPDDKAAAASALRRYRHLASLEPTRDLVGAFTRAIHDLQLLRGEATARGQVVVHFGIPRPVEPVDVLDVDLDAVDG